MNNTNHASEREQQRGISRLARDVLMGTGLTEFQNDGTWKLHLDRKSITVVVSSLKYIIQKIEKFQDITMILSKDGSKIITIYRGRKLWKKEKQHF